MHFRSLSRQQIPVIILLVLGGFLAEFLVLEGAIGVSLPSGRYSASSRLEIKTKGVDLHFITQNMRFDVVDLWTEHGTHREALVLRESFFMDREDGREGPPEATVKVEGLAGERVKWTFQEPGDVVTDNLYRVIRESNGESPKIYTYFSLVDGRKVRVQKSADLSRDELEALDVSIAK